MNPDKFHSGDRIILIHMHNDPYPVPDGTRGTVEYVDDAGQVHVRWDTGSGLAAIPGVDDFRHLTAKELADERK